MKRYLNIGKSNLKFNLAPHILLSLLFLCISPFLMGVQNLDAIKTAQVLEMYVALLGIILLTPLFLPEQNKDIKDLVDSKYTPSSTVYLIRIFEAMLVLMLLVIIYILMLKNNNCTFPVLKYYFGTLAGALFLGGLGILGYRIFDHIAIAYMLPIVYYMMAFSGASKLLHNFNLFSMIHSSYTEKVYLAIGGCLFILLGILPVRQLKNRFTNKSC